MSVRVCGGFQDVFTLCIVCSFAVGVCVHAFSVILQVAQEKLSEDCVCSADSVVCASYSAQSLKSLNLN